ncbi:hypothetical protein BDV93DRAFT_584877 [Ceratobasidium sp. AG-I]|nr:hypothetical protein BDV93DRAFT_584877 [Ceratobasidium sp. AG-I]
MPQHRNRIASEELAGGNTPPTNAHSEDDMEQVLDDNASLEEWKEVALQFQLENNNHKRQLAEVTRERDTLVTRGGRKRRRRRRSEPTPEDPKYEAAGKRCALFWMLWLSPDLFAIQIEDAYSDARRYRRNSPDMQAQGERKDLLSSMSQTLADSFSEEHFQKVFGRGVSEQRRNAASRIRACGSLIFGCSQELFVDKAKRADHAEFKRLLGFREEGETVVERYPSLAPVLYLNGQKGNTHQLFKSKYIKKAFRAYLFGPSSVSDKPSEHKGGQRKLVEVLGAKTITPGAIAAAATLTRWCISPDDEFSPVGSTSTIRWKIDYQQYKKVLIQGLQAERGVYDKTGVIGPYSKLFDEWSAEFFPTTREDDPEMRDNSNAPEEDPEIAEALAEINEFVENN